MGIGAWAWGDSLFWGYDPRKDDELREVFDFVAARKDGFVDTAELYGIGRSESLIAQFERGGGSVKVASKFAALPWRTKRGDVVKACRASLKRLEADSMDLYQIHFPNAWANEAYWDGLADCFDLGLVKSVGVSNYGSDAVRAVASTLEARGIALASNQIQYSLVYPFANANGLKRTCDDLGVTVAINWCRAKGAVPIPGCRTLAQVTQNYDALGWKMDGADVALLDAAANKLKPPGSAGFPEKDINTGMRMFDS
ncbi:oxidoreductase [Aureococcus anophagefferens]|nr:oxidoreductase [Aureococcus anophagefferens]